MFSLQRKGKKKSTTVSARNLIIKKEKVIFTFLHELGEKLMFSH